MNVRYRGRLAGIALLGMAFVSANAAPGAGLAAASGGAPAAVTDYHPDGVSGARDAAQDQLEEFLTQVLGPNGHAPVGASLKIDMTGTRSAEAAVWVTPVDLSGEMILGHPVGSPASKAGLIAFRADQVLDWSFAGPDGRLYGNFAIRALLPSLDPVRAAGIARTLSEHPAPAKW